MKSIIVQKRTLLTLLYLLLDDCGSLLWPCVNDVVSVCLSLLMQVIAPSSGGRVLIS